ncbi:hypothetical protein LX95_00803 [Mesonia algae]|uniref:Lipoprotein n=1 Tax=Mesonia algae TaxID=213248 RepID=A0A2W7I6H1_9FLAO|nr:hypothetical protein [Mesonia algae]PZW42491.1 hypothetical protein LX95_00803 [Mesonia algae]
MKFVILVAVFLLIILLITTGCAQIVGGISQKKAATNLEQYLQIKYNGQLTFKDLNRYFNAATMDPNIFSVVVYDKQVPEIEFYTHINAKTILENDTLPLYPKADAIVFDDLYREILKRYNIRQEVIADFKAEISKIVFSDNDIEFTFNEDLNPNKLNDIVTRFINRLNQSFKQIDSAYELSLLIKTPEYPGGFINITLDIENAQYTPGPYLLSENLTNFEMLETKLEAYMQAKLDTNYPYFKIISHRKIYMDKSSLSKGAWIQYLDDKRVKNTESGRWVNPQKGLFVVYFDLQSSFIYRAEMLSEENDKTSKDQENLQIKEALEAEGIKIQ